MTAAVSPAAPVPPARDVVAEIVAALEVRRDAEMTERDRYGIHSCARVEHDSCVDAFNAAITIVREVAGVS